jgi:hypothetical protein
MDATDAFVITTQGLIAGAVFLRSAAGGQLRRTAVWRFAREEL